ncbi:MAG: beta-aspartyl-peptidase [Bacillota bacterium]|nr:beta-aspartyl-peptidase [Bacillota bacterium]
MFTLLKNIECYYPKYAGKKNFLISFDKIYKILPAQDKCEINICDRIIDCEGLTAFPGLIDQHVHITGGGGEQGFGTRIKEIDIGEILMTGVTTVVGLLGADGYTRSLEVLYAKAKALELEGITTFIYSGSYEVPAVTLTGNIAKDLIFIDKVLGAGEIAISDHRSSQQDLNKMLELSSQTHLGGMIGGKAGVVHLHVGDGKSGLKILKDILNNSDLPIEMFVPTHVNRNPELFREAIEYCRSGGNIDLTAGEKVGIPVPEAIKTLIDQNVDISRVTVSSDANGGSPQGVAAKINVLFDDLKDCVVNKKINPEIFAVSTENVAKILKLYPRKGVLKENSDADILIIDSNFNVKMLFSMGKLLIENGCVTESISGG